MKLKSKLKKRLVIFLIAVAMVLAVIPILPTASAADINVPGDYATINAAITAAAPGDTIHVAAGTYDENLASWKNMEITKSLTIIGAGSGQTIVTLDKQNGVEIRGSGLAVYLQGLTFTRRSPNTYAANFNLKIAETASTFTVLSLIDVEVAYARAPNVNLGTNGVYQSVLIQDCNFHHAGTWGFMSQGQIPNGMTVTNSHFDNNGLVDASHGIGFDLTSYSGSSNIVVTGGTFNNNYVKGINLLKTSSATFTNIVANNNGFHGSGGHGVSLWEWAGTSSNIVFNNPTLNGNNLDGFLIGSEGGCTVNGVTINDGTLQNNGRGGLFIYNMGGVIQNIKIEHSNIVGNTPWGVWTNTAPAVDARLNWWGSASGPGGVASGSGDDVSTNVLYCLWLNAAWPSGTGIGRAWNTRTGEQFCSIQAGIDSLNTIDGDTIEAYAGPHPGNIIVYKEVTVRSADPCGAIINANQIDFSTYQNAWGKGINYAWAQAYDPGLLDNGFLVFKDNVVIDGFKIINADYYDYNRGIGILIGSIHTTYAGFVPWNIDQWGGIVPNPDEPTPTGVIIQNNCIDGASDGIYNWASNGNIIQYNTITNSVVLGGMGIQCYEGGTDNIIRGNTIDNVAGAGVSVCGAWPNYLLDVSNTLVYDNTITNGNVGIQFYNMGGSGVAAYHNDILNNNNGIVVEGVGGATVGTAYENNIVGNSNYGVVNTCPDGTFIATCNWWGDISGPSGVAAGSGDAVSTFVEYCPWLDAAYPDGTCGGGGYIMCDLQGPFYTSALDDYFVHICGHCSYVSICGVLVEATSYLWDWGDGTTSTTQCADHTYDPDCPTEAGFVQYWVTFTVRYQSGDYDLTCSDTALVTVYCDDNDPPIVSLTSPNGGETLTGTETISWYALDTDMGKDVNIYLFYTADNGANWRQIGGTLHNNIDTEHGDYQWSTTSLADGQYRLMVEAMDDYHNMAVAKSQPFTISNGIAVATVSDVQIRDTTIDSNTWVKDGDNLEITAAITGGSSISRESIKADLSGFGLGSSVTANSYDGFIATWYLPTVQCDPSDGSITVIVTIGETSNSATITADNTQPDITNIKPTNGLYVFNTKIIVLPRPLIIGPITLQVTASDLSGISRVDFNVDDELQQTITQEPFVWDMSQKLKGTHDLDFVVYDVAGNTETISTAATFLNLFG